MNTGAFIHDLLDWIDNNLESRLDIDTVSRRAGYSKWHLQRIFKEHTGHPIGEYIRARKLQKSLERLTRSDEPILNVAIALGFDSQQSFNRSFKFCSKVFWAIFWKKSHCMNIVLWTHDHFSATFKFFTEATMTHQN